MLSCFVCCHFEENNVLSSSDLPGVVRVIPSRVYNLHTTRSWDFLQVNDQIGDGILLKGRFGSDSIIGVLDSGVCRTVGV